MDNLRNIMVVTPHPDDGEYGVAGTVAQWTRKGKRVIYVVCTNGNKGTSDYEVRSEDLVKIREKIARVAAIATTSHQQYVKMVHNQIAMVTAKIKVTKIRNRLKFVPMDP